MKVRVALLSLALAGFSPFQVEERHVREGNEKLVARDAPGALERYDQAEATAGPHPEIDFDRAHALQQQGKAPEAQAAWRRVLERKPSDALASRALQNLGTSLAGAGDRDGALKAMAEALQRDPGNEDARFNLEVLLRQQAQQQQQQQQGNQGQQGQPQQQDPKKDPGQPPPSGRQRQEQQQAGDPDRPKQEPKQQAQQSRQQQDKQARREGAEAQAAPLTRQDAERLLDALRSREKQLPPVGRDPQGGRRADAAKDW